METHAHLEDHHGAQVVTGRRDGDAALYFSIQCPVCRDVSERRVNPRGRDEEFLERFGRETRLVAFDILLYHLQADHPEAIGLDAPAQGA